MKEVEVPKDYDYKREIKWQKTWRETDIYQFRAEENRPRYIIDTPPPGTRESWLHILLSSPENSPCAASGPSYPECFLQ